MALSRNDLVAELAAKTGSTKKDVDEFVTAFAELVIDSVAKGEKISIPGVLSVERVQRAARTGRNPQTGAEIAIAETEMPGLMALRHEFGVGIDHFGRSDLDQHRRQAGEITVDR